MSVERRMGVPTSVRVSEIIRENKTTSTLLFQHEADDLTVEPGQFFMIWIPGIDEIPMSISYWDSPVAGVSVLPVGDATSALASQQVGEWIGVRGPFGTSFSTDAKKALVVGGGIGTAPLRLLVHDLLARGADVTLLLAARTKDSLLFLKEFSTLRDEAFHLLTATDDGSEGFKGLATEAAEGLLEKESFDAIYTCGPELMMVGLHRLAQEKRIHFEASLERHMKCGCGICGSCVLDPTGELVCLDGPVFTGERLLNITDFGKYERDEMGRKKKF